MSFNPTLANQNGAQAPPPDLRTPNGSRILVLATPSPSLQDDGAAQTALNNLDNTNVPTTPLVINDTFDSVESPDHPITPPAPPLTQSHMTIAASIPQPTERQAELWKPMEV
ncbi:hypothetical protein C8T65DRAFT_740299 [Cerioporus squamosus]|nr:hypothetical protein C8T65DRAFT_740299 [Cerioporus squamosus]